MVFPLAVMVTLSTSASKWNLLLFFPMPNSPMIRAMGSSPYNQETLIIFPTV